MTTTSNQIWETVYELLAKNASNDDVSNLLRELEKTEASDEEKSLLRGYIAYHFPCVATQNIGIDAELNTVLLSDPTNTTARLYLSHFYYDSGQYAEALEQLRLIDRERYIEAGQQWRALKIQELMLASLIHISAKSLAPEEVARFLDDLDLSSIEDTAIPVELVQSLASKKFEIVEAWTSPVLSKIGLRLREILQKLGGTTTLRKEIDALVA